MNELMSVLIVGVGHMGLAHAKAYQRLESCQIVGIVSRSIRTNKTVKALFPDVELFENYHDALHCSNPDIVVIATYPDTHADYAVTALEQGAHVFVEKPIAVTLEEARAVVAAAESANRKLLIGYILQFHPSWKLFGERASELGRPLVMRMNLNQQSSSNEWNTHRAILASGTSPIVDCGVHYVDFMCNLVGALPTRVSGISARLDASLTTDNYGHLQVEFADGSIGWYEAGWGPMISENAFFVKDVIGPNGSVSMAVYGDTASLHSESSEVGSHVQTEQLLLHSSAINGDGRFVQSDRIESTAGEPDHDELCFLEQEYLVRAIRDDLDLTAHQSSAISSLQIVLAAAESAKTGETIRFEALDDGS